MSPRSRRQEPSGSGRSPAGGILLAVTALALWFSWMQVARVLPWADISDGAVVACAAITLLLLLLLPLAPALSWLAGRRGTGRYVALVFGLLAYGAIIAVDLMLVGTLG